MASYEFLKTMTSSNQKRLFLKFELLEYDSGTRDFEVIDESIVEERHLPNGVSNIGGMITSSTEQDARVILDVQIANHDSMNNWGDEFDSNDPETFEWWLDKRLNVYMGLQIDSSDDTEYVRMGHFVVTHFKTNHELVDFPVIEIQGASKEVLFASRKGKFLYDTTIRANTVMTETIKTILRSGGELDTNIRIDPSIADNYFKLEDGTEIDKWKVFFNDAYIRLDSFDFATPESSIRVDINTNEMGILMEKTFITPVDMRSMQALAFFGRCSRDVENGDLSLVLVNENGVKKEYPFLEMVGHVIGVDDDPQFVDNWRNVVLDTSDFGELNRVVKMQLKINKSGFKTPYSIWIDEIHMADIRNLLPYELTFGAGDNRWSAVKEIAYLLNAVPSYDEYGNFLLMKEKIPKERFEGTFDYDAYEVLEPKVVYNDRKKGDNIYAGNQDDFNEHELSNHIQVTGGSTYDSVMSLVDLQVREQGLEMREKGKYINRRGKIRAVDQFYEGAEPTVFNKDTDVAKVYKYHKNKDTAVEENSNGFPQTTEPPIINYAIERIGDYIYHHNNANPDPVIVYAYEGKNRALYELRRRLAHAEQLTILSAPYYTLRLNDIIRVEDSLLELDDNYEITGMSVPLNGEYMNINTVKIKNKIIDIPYFDKTHPKANACWYGYDMYGLTFTYNFWRTRVTRDEEIGKYTIEVRHSGSGRGKSEITQNEKILGENSSRRTGNEITHPKYIIRALKDEDIEIDITPYTTADNEYVFVGIADESGRSYGTTISSSDLYENMKLDIKFRRK